MSFQSIISGRSTLLHTAALATAAMGLVWATRRLIRERNRYNVNGKVVLITGGSRGLGLVLARELAWRGACLVICARDEAQLGRATMELKSMGATVMGLVVDIRDADQVRQMMRTVVEEFGTLDVLINNAGIIQVGPTESMDIEDFQQAMDTNFWGSLYCMLEAIPYFKAQRAGRIVNITSIGGKLSVPHLLPYSASKFAAVGLSEGMHTALRKFNINVTTVIPDLMQTGSPRQITVKGKHQAEYAWFKMAASLPMVSQKVERSASAILDALETGAAKVTLTSKASAAILLKEIAPAIVQSFLSLAERLLPAAPAGTGGMVARKGYESESLLSRNVASRGSDRAAEKNNEY